jgi:hypothetical protein
VDELPIALHDFRVGVDKIATDAGVVDPDVPRARLRAFQREVRRQVDQASPGESVFFRGMHEGLAQAATDDFRLPLPGALIRDRSHERYAGGVVAGALLHEWLRGDRRATSEVEPMYAFGRGLGFQVNQHHLCDPDPGKTRLVHRVCCVYVEKRHGAIPIHTEMFLVAWLLRVRGYRTDEIDMDGYLAERTHRWNWMPPRQVTA